VLGRQGWQDHTYRDRAHGNRAHGIVITILPISSNAMCAV
jgi:hypothetical protein